MNFTARIIHLLYWFRWFFSSRKELLLRITLLERQLKVFMKEKPRPRLSRWDRFLWVLLRRCWGNWKSALVLVKPETVVRWRRNVFKLYWAFLCKRGKDKKKGKPPIRGEIIRLIRRFAEENITWRAPRIHGELVKLGFKISERTVSRYLKKLRPRQNGPSKWKSFLKNQRKGIVAMDFLTVPTLFFSQLYVFFIISHDRRKIIHYGVTYHPSSLWVTQQMKNAFSSLKTSLFKYMIHDRDSIFSTRVIETLKSLGIESVRTSIKSPWQNGIAERWVGNCRRELLDHVIILNEKHLLRLLEEYVAYYNEDRNHYSLDKDPPISRPVLERESEDDTVIALPRVGGLHHKYVWEKAA